MVRKFWCCLPLFVTLACGTGEADKSDLNWSHVETEKSTGSIPALLAYDELGFSRDTKGIKVCIQESSSYGGSQLRLETKLAYAAWLEASGRGTAENWERFDFDLAERCDLDDTNYSSHVVIASLEKPDPSQSDNFTVINCSTRSCMPNGFTTGWGGPATINYSYNTATPKKWSSIRLYQPSMARLSPYLRWQSLETEFALQLKAARAQSFAARTPKLSEARLQTLLDGYVELRQKSRLVTYAELVAFNSKLASYRVDSKAGYSIVNTREADSPVYQMQMAGYHTLLHEVGHQFGMMHAHVKSGYTDNGAVTGTGAIKEDGYWTTDDATMAYNNTYFFLSADDKAGIRHLTDELYSYLRARR